MATKKVTANTTAQSLWSQVKPLVGILSKIEIDNQGDAPNTIELEDSFTPDASVGTPTPGPQVIPRWQHTVGAKETYSEEGEKLKDVKFLGAAQAKGSVTDSKCVIIAAYSLK